VFSSYELQHLARERADELRREAHAVRLARCGRVARLHRRGRPVARRRLLTVGARGHAG
jgi:hypothetical protein